MLCYFPVNPTARKQFSFTYPKALYLRFSCNAKTYVFFFFPECQSLSTRKEVGQCCGKEICPPLLRRGEGSRIKRRQYVETHPMLMCMFIEPVSDSMHFTYLWMKSSCPCLHTNACAFCYIRIKAPSLWGIFLMWICKKHYN